MLHMGDLYLLDFPGGTVDRNPPVSTGDTVRALVQEDPTSLGATATEPVCLEPMLATREATAKNKQKVN